MKDAAYGKAAVLNGQADKVLESDLDKIEPAEENPRAKKLVIPYDIKARKMEILDALFSGDYTAGKDRVIKEVLPSKSPLLDYIKSLGGILYIKTIEGAAMEAMSLDDHMLDLIKLHYSDKALRYLYKSETKGLEKIVASLPKQLAKCDKCGKLPIKDEEGVHCSTEDCYVNLYFPHDLTEEKWNEQME